MILRPACTAMPDSPTPSPSSTMTTSPTRRPFVLITGLSGAGRATALHALEDLGYVAVDNVPLPLLGDLVRSTSGGFGDMPVPLAFGVDTRTYGFDPHDLQRRLQELRLRADLAPRLLFLDCDTEILQRRYTESRRPHPMAPDRPVNDGIVDERRLIGRLRDSADVLIDTPGGQIPVAELKKNGFVGEIAILCDVPRTATIKARESLATLRISKDMFYRLVAEFPQMAIEIMRELAHRLEDTNEKLRNATKAAA